MATPKSPGQLLGGGSRSGRGFYYGGRRVLLMNEPGLLVEWAGDGVAQFSQDVLEATFKTLETRGLQYMQSITPVDSGDLQRSDFAELAVSQGRVLLTIGATEPYAMFVELGTSSHDAQPFIRPTFDYLASAVGPMMQAEAKARGG